YMQSHKEPEYHQPISMPPFQPPDFDRLNQSILDWIKAAKAAFEQYIAMQIEEIQGWESEGVDEKIDIEKRSRDHDQDDERRNPPVPLRHELAARRLLGMAWKNIAADPDAESTVKKAASEALRAAGWPTKTKTSA